jgi:hypothetical protein
MTSTDQKYKVIRLKEDEYEKLKEVQAYLRRKGTDALDWEELNKQSIVEIPNEKQKEEDNELTLGFLVGVGAAALAYLIWKNSKK